MSTGSKYASLTNKRLLGLTELKDRFLDYLRELVREQLETAYGTDGVFDTPIAITADGNDKFQLTPDVETTDGAGSILVTAAGLTDGIQFENTSAVVYFIGLKRADRPKGIDVNPRTGLPEIDAFEETIGERDDPDAVTDNGPNITLEVDSVAETGRDNTGRKCLVWMKNPVKGAITEAIAIEEATVFFSASKNQITTVGLLGQTTVSTDPTDYEVLLLGPSVRRDTDLRTVAGYVYIGTVTGAGAGNPPTVFDTTGQNPLESSALALLSQITRVDTHGYLKVEVKADASDSGEDQIRVKNYAGDVVFAVDEDGNMTVKGTTSQEDVVTVTSSETVTDNLTAGDAAGDSHLVKGTWEHKDDGATRTFFKVDGTTGAVTVPGGTGLDPGVDAVGGDTGGVGVEGTGTGTGGGVKGTGGTTSGVGVWGVGGAPSGRGVSGTGAGAAAGAWGKASGENNSSLGVHGVGDVSGAATASVGVKGEGAADGAGDIGTGVEGVGAGIGAGVYGIGGTTSGIGTQGVGGTPDGDGMRGQSKGTGAGVRGLASGESNSSAGVRGIGDISGAATTSDGITGEGAGTAGAGVAGTGADTGAGVKGTGGTTSGAGVFGIGGTPDGRGISGTGSGVAPGVHGNASGASNSSVGVRGVGSVSGAATASVGVKGEGAAAGAGDIGTGIEGVGAGAGAGLKGTASGANDASFGVHGIGDVSGAATASVGVRGEGAADGASDLGHGVEGVGEGAGAGVKGVGGATDDSSAVLADGASSAATDANGVTATGKGAGYGAQGTGGATGIGVEGVGGSSSGSGLKGTGSAGNAIGVEGEGQGSAQGIKGTGGATGIGVEGVGGLSSGFGVKGTGSAGNAIGVIGEGEGSGSGVDGTGGDSGGRGVVGEGGTDGIGVQGVGGAPNGTGVKALASGTGAALDFNKYLEGAEMADPAAPASNKGRIYFRDTGGKTELVVVFPTGAVQQIAIEP